LAIPAEQTERIIPAARIQTVLYETEGQEAFISLPLLLQSKDSAPHGVVLKTAAIQPPEGILRTILLTPKIDIDLEIPEEKIHQLPQTFLGLYRFFRGAYFDDQNVILILNTEKLAEVMR
jgi:hypothetical protein